MKEKERNGVRNLHRFNPFSECSEQMRYYNDSRAALNMESLMEERNELSGGTQAVFSMWKVVSLRRNTHKHKKGLTEG